MEILLFADGHTGRSYKNRRLKSFLRGRFAAPVTALSRAIEAKDPYTRGHCESVARLAVEVARRLGLPSGALRDVQCAALLHDVGKIGVPDGILLKPGRLLPEEFAVIQKHSQIGSDIVRRVPRLRHIASVILHHHERLDGSGYPEGRCGDEISLPARIIGAVDAFDAMTSSRPYRDAMPVNYALSELQRGAGRHFDTAVVEALTSLVAP